MPPSRRLVAVLRREGVAYHANMSIGTVIRDVREQRNWTQAHLADAAGVDKRTIQRIESGEVSPRAETIMALQNALGIEFDKTKRGGTSGEEIQNPIWRRWLNSAQALLNDAEFELLDDADKPVANPGHRLIPGERLTLAATLAHRTWTACNASVLSPAMTPVPDPRPDMLALTLGMSLGDLRRFLGVHLAGLTASPFGNWCIRFEGTESPSEDDARFAIDFATQWVLRVQQRS